VDLIFRKVVRLRHRQAPPARPFPDDTFSGCVMPFQLERQPHDPALVGDSAHQLVSFLYFWADFPKSLYFSGKIHRGFIAPR
jgi:hypothetical protein